MKYLPYKLIYISFILILAIGCSESTFNSFEEEKEQVQLCSRLSIDSSLVVSNENEVILIAGTKEEEIFNITNSDIDICKLNQGLGREYFPALFAPEYTELKHFDYSDNMRCIVIKDQGAVKVYPYSLLSQHEVINENVGDEPVVIVFCELAELAVVYTRKYCNKEFNFAPSGFTYFDNNFWDGVQGILMWDRETESLWWPLNDHALSGLMRNTLLEKANFHSRSYSQAKFQFYYLFYYQTLPI